MRFFTLKRYPRIFRVLLAGGLMAPLMGGCPIDTDQLATDVTQAILTSITNSLVEALSQFLAAS